MSDGGWEDSAEAWIASLGADGDFTRRYLTDPAILGRLEGRVFRSALDVGCGEGRFCRILRGLGIATMGVDPTRRLIDEAMRCDPAGDYRVGRAEALDFADGSFDLVVSYLSLIDIAGLREAVAIPAEWEGIRIVNWHRPLSTYLRLLLEQGLRLVDFAEPRPIGGAPDDIVDYERAPWAYVMEWRKS